MRQSFRCLHNPWLAILVLLLPCQACALSYVDREGNHHVIGLVDISIQSSKTPQTFAGDVVDITAVGLSAGQTAQGGYITLGYSNEASATLRDNALVIGDPLNLLTKSPQKTPAIVP
jgi:hypothetical protein